MSATTNDNKIRRRAKHRLLRFNYRFRWRGRNWKCRPRKSTKIYNEYVEATCEHKAEIGKVEEQFLNVRSTNKGKHPKNSHGGFSLPSGKGAKVMSCKWFEGRL